MAVDRQLKSGFGTYEAAEKAAQEIKKKYPSPQVTVLDAKKAELYRHRATDSVDGETPWLSHLLQFECAVRSLTHRGTRQVFGY